MRTLALFAALAALALPAAALATKPPHPAKTTTTTTPAVPTVSYVLHGTLSSYVAATASANGSVKIHVTAGNHQGALQLKGHDVTLALSSTTKIVLHAGKPIADGDRGTIKVRGPKNLAPTAVAQQVIDQG
jgi:hypothetical protein